MAPNYLSNRIDMHFDIHIERGFLYLGGKLWNDLPNFEKNSTNIQTHVKQPLTDGLPRVNMFW